MFANHSVSSYMQVKFKFLLFEKKNINLQLFHILLSF